MLTCSVATCDTIVGYVALRPAGPAIRGLVKRESHDLWMGCRTGVPGRISSSPFIGHDYRVCTRLLRFQLRLRLRFRRPLHHCPCPAGPPPDAAFGAAIGAFASPATTRRRLSRPAAPRRLPRPTAPRRLTEPPPLPPAAAQPPSNLTPPPYFLRRPPLNLGPVAPPPSRRTATTAAHHRAAASHVIIREKKRGVIHQIT